MGGMGLIFTPAMARRLLRPSSLVWTYDQYFLDSLLFQTVLMEGLTRLRLPTSPFHPPHPLPSAHPLIRAIRDNTMVVKKVAQNPAVLASYYR